MALEGEHDPTMSEILLVDADSLLRGELRAALRQTDLHLIEAGDGEVGLAQFRANNPDLLLTEVSLPGKGGLELIAEILATRPQTKVFACSQPLVDRGVDLLEIATLLGATRTFRKPIDVPELVEAIRDELRPDERFSH
jgi:DNA-binding response OmpR family regulator